MERHHGTVIYAILACDIINALVVVGMESLLGVVFCRYEKEEGFWVCMYVWVGMVAFQFSIVRSMAVKYKTVSFTVTSNKNE